MVLLPVSPATGVLRQKRSLAKAAASVSAVEPRLTVKMVPPSWFSGRPPSAGGLNRGSRQLPVHVGGSAGSITALAWVSLYDTRVRFWVAVPSMAFSQRVFQKISFPLKNARCTPAL